MPRLPAEILKKVRSIEIRTRHIVNDVFAGEFHSAFQGQGMEFQEVREYVAGDDIRDIDWNVTARMQRPFIKKFTEERETNVLLVVDVSASHEFGTGKQLKREVAAEIAAILAFSAIKNNDKVGLLLHSDQVEKFIPPRKGGSHVLRVVSEVLDAKPKSKGSDLAPALKNINLVTRRKTIIFLIGDFILPDTYQRPLTVMGRRHDVVSIIIGDEREHKWPMLGLVEWRDNETGKRRLVDTSSPFVRRALAKRFAKRRERITQQLRRSGVDLLEINLGGKAEPYERSLMRFFKRRASESRR